MKVLIGATGAAAALCLGAVNTSFISRPGNMPTVAARHTAAVALTTSYAVIPFDTTDTESDDSLIDHVPGGGTPERVTVKVAGNFLITYAASWDIQKSPSTTVWVQTQCRIAVNGVEHPGSVTQEEAYHSGSQDYFEAGLNAWSQTVTLAANDYVTLECRYVEDPTPPTTPDSVNAIEDITMSVTQLVGPRGPGGGPIGPAGPIGPTGPAGASSHATFRATKSGTQLVDLTEADIATWNTPELTDADFTWTAATGVLTINTTGEYMVNIDVECEGAGGDDGAFLVKPQEDVGAGFVDIAGTSFRGNLGKAREAGRGSTFLRSWTATDDLKIRIVRIDDDDCTIPDKGVRLNVVGFQ